MPAARPDPEHLFHPISTHAHVALAVSGGSDSMALMRLAAQWKAATGKRPALTVLTVDHGLRAASAEETRKVAGWAAAQGLRHVSLAWEGAKPETGLQAKARAARYGLMCDWCRDHGASALLTAHTLDDQAETVLMRLARTVSLDSLAGIYRFSEWQGIMVFRPLLGERRQALRTYLGSVGQEWVEDPSNEDERFERVRIRKAMPVLNELGITAEALAGLAACALDATHALWGATEDWVNEHVTIHEAGYGTVPLTAFADQTPDLQARILGWLICRFGAGRMPEPAGLEHLCAWLSSDAAGRRTLGGAVVARRKESLIIGREPGRISRAPVVVPDSGSCTWDRRFVIRARPGSQVIPALCAGPLARRKDLPGFVQQALPAVIQPGEAVVVPHLGKDGGIDAVFQPRLRR